MAPGSAGDAAGIPNWCPDAQPFTAARPCTHTRQGPLTHLDPAACLPAALHCIAPHPIHTNTPHGARPVTCALALAVEAPQRHHVKRVAHALPGPVGGRGEGGGGREGQHGGKGQGAARGREGRPGGGGVYGGRGCRGERADAGGANGHEGEGMAGRLERWRAGGGGGGASKATQQEAAPHSVSAPLAWACRHTTLCPKHQLPAPTACPNRPTACPNHL